MPDGSTIPPADVPWRDREVTRDCGVRTIGSGASAFRSVVTVTAIETGLTNRGLDHPVSSQTHLKNRLGRPVWLG